MNAKIYVALSILMSMTAFAVNDLGSLEKARKDHPAIFVPGNALEYTIDNEIGYVYNGEAEKCFEGALAESDAELFQEASLDAKRNLYKFLTKDDKSLEVQMGEARKLYEFAEAKMRRVVMFVCKDKVSVVAKSKLNHGVSNSVVDTVEAKAPVVVKNMNSQERSEAQLITNVAMAATLDPVSNDRKDVEKETPADMLPIYLDAIAKSPTDCISMSKAAKLYARRNDIATAKKMYSRVVKQVVADEHMDKEFAAGLLLEAAKFEAANGDVDCALKYYRLIVRCDGMRRWSLHEQVDEANKNISQLLLKAF